MKKFLFFALIIISFFSCTEEKPKDMISMFKTERHVDCPSAGIETDSLGAPMLMEHTGSQLLFASMFQPKLLSFFDSESGRFLGSSVTKGEGPGEYLMPFTLSVGGDELGFWDAGKRVFVSLPKDYPQCENLSGKETPIALNDSLLDVFHVIRAGEGHLVATGIIKNHRAALLDSEGHTLTLFGAYPEQRTTLTDAENGFLFQGVSAYNSEEHVIALASLMGESISFFSLKDQAHPVLLKEYSFDNSAAYELSGDADQPVAFLPDCKIGFLDIKAYKSSFVGLFSGRPREGKNAYGGDKLLFFGRDGEPSELVYLNRSYTNIAVDRTKDVVYLFGTDSETGEYVIDECNPQ